MFSNNFQINRYFSISWRRTYIWSIFRSDFLLVSDRIPSGFCKLSNKKSFFAINFTNPFAVTGWTTFLFHCSNHCYFSATLFVLLLRAASYWSSESTKFSITKQMIIYWFLCLGIKVFGINLPAALVQLPNEISKTFTAYDVEGTKCELYVWLWIRQMFTGKFCRCAEIRYLCGDSIPKFTGLNTWHV